MNREHWMKIARDIVREIDIENEPAEAACVEAIAAALEEAYDDGYDKGYDAGYHENDLPPDSLD